jgi:hypothetical protein
MFRQSSPLLASIVKRAAQALYTTIMDFGEEVVVNNFLFCFCF